MYVVHFAGHHHLFMDDVGLRQICSLLQDTGRFSSCDITTMFSFLLRDEKEENTLWVCLKLTGRVILEQNGNLVSNLLLGVRQIKIWNNDQSFQCWPLKKLLAGESKIGKMYRSLLYILHRPHLLNYLCGHINLLVPTLPFSLPTTTSHQITLHCTLFLLQVNSIVNDAYENR